MPTTEDLNPAHRLVELFSELAKNDDAHYWPMEYSELQDYYAHVKSAVDAALYERHVTANDVARVVRGSYSDDERNFFLVTLRPELSSATLVFWEDVLIGDNAAS